MSIPSFAAEMITTCQLFWKSTEVDFPDRQSLTCTLKLNNSRQCVQFPFPDLAQPVQALRLDIADSPANVVVLSVALRDAGQAVQWQWDGAPDLFVDLAETRLVTGELDGPVVLLASWGLDPRCRLAIPADVLAQVQGGWHLELIVSPQVDPLHDVLRDSLAHHKQIGALSKLVVEQRQQMEQLSRTAREQAQRIEQLAEDSKVQQRVIARYEENDAIIRKKLAEQDSVLNAILGNKWLRRLFSFKQAPST